MDVVSFFFSEESTDFFDSSWILAADDSPFSGALDIPLLAGVIEDNVLVVWVAEPLVKFVFDKKLNEDVVGIDSALKPENPENALLVVP